MRKMVIFDCDGVLVDTENVSTRELTRSINELGVPMSFGEVKRTFKGDSVKNIADAVATRSGRPVPDGWLSEFQRRRAAAFREGVEAIAGVASLIDEVRRSGFETCVASQASLEKVQLTLGLTGLIDRFPPDRLFSSSMVARGKPSPDLFLHAAMTCGVEPQRCVVIEDGVAGVIAARAAGMRALAFCGDPDTDPDAMAQAGGEVFRSMSEVPALLAARDEEHGGG